MFQHTADELKQAAQAALELAKQKGATAAEVDLSESLGQNVQVRWREIEQIEYQQDQSLDITVFVGHSKGRASTADLSPQALASTVQAACDIARYPAADPHRRFRPLPRMGFIQRKRHRHRQRMRRSRAICRQPHQQFRRRKHQHITLSIRLCQFARLLPTPARHAPQPIMQRGCQR